MGAGDSGDTITKEGRNWAIWRKEDGFCAVRLSGVAQVLASLLSSLKLLTEIG